MNLLPLWVRRELLHVVAQLCHVSAELRRSPCQYRDSLDQLRW